MKSVFTECFLEDALYGTYVLGLYGNESWQLFVFGLANTLIMQFDPLMLVVALLSSNFL
jgi:hypothetical protein